MGIFCFFYNHLFIQELGDGIISARGLHTVGGQMYMRKGRKYEV